MEYKGISPSELADSIGVQRSNVTHVLKARNKPSFQFIEKMLQIYPELNAKWLILGTGTMVDSPAKSKTLFDQLAEPPGLPEQKTAKTEEKPLITDTKPPETRDISSPPVADKTAMDHEVQDQFFSSEKPVERLIVFFKDQTFKVYHPSR